MKEINDKYDLNIFSTNLKYLRLKEELTQQELAARLEINTSQISNWERSINLPVISQMIKICEFFNVSIDSMFDPSLRKSFKSIGFKLKELRLTHGLTQVEFAEKFGLTEATIRKWEKDIITLSSNHIYKICNMYNITPNELLGYEEKKLCE